jgi:hypothetical protein
MAKPGALTIALLIAAGALAQARVMPPWDFQRLFDVSDAVLVVEPIANENNTDQWEWAPKFAQGVTTTFRVWARFKGVLPGNGVKTIRVRHFLYRTGPIPDGGILINFPPDPFDAGAEFKMHEAPEPGKFQNVRWLAFLKKGADGFFVPTSGQIDPSFSFEELHGADAFDPTHGVISSH